MSTILIGTSSWTDKTLIDCGRFYPPTATRPEERLRFYASQFPIVEIDSSYYGVPSVENAQRWVERTSPGFVCLGKEIAQALTPVSKKNVYDKDLPAEITMELWRQFRAVLEVLREVASSVPFICSSCRGSRSIRRRLPTSNTAVRCSPGSPWP
jgi:uncharacterized protein YecE (DUF72 family)